MTAHDPRVTLTEAEVDRLVFEFGDHTNIYALTDTVADLIAARLASELRQAGQDFLASEAARGPARPAFVRRWLHARADALDAPQDAPRGPVGGEQGAEVAEGRSEGEGPGEGDFQTIYRFIVWIANSAAYNGSPRTGGQSLYNEGINAFLPRELVRYFDEEGQR